MQRIFINETISKIGERVMVSGWVNVRRDHGKIIFIDLRDRSGLLQVVFSNPTSNSRSDLGETLRSDLMGKADQLRSEWVVSIEGTIKERPENLKNSKIETGGIEISAETLEILNPAQNLPFEINNDGNELNEETRLKYRYIDLRRERMKRNIRIKHEVSQFIRKYLTEKGFWEVETPILTKSTPEGARDFLVPSRLQKGKFYALPQSPQQYKQLLMISGVEKYFQIARCFRDEDPRADRAYGEFTQLDLEMSFVEQEDILRLIEDLFTKMVQVIFPEKKITKSPWPRLTHKEAQDKYGTDKPDLRKDKNDPAELAFSWTVDFPLFTEQTKEDFFHGSGSAKFAPSHHMFTAPHPDDISLLDTDPIKVRGLQHDLVLNGFEVGGGSMRIHDPKIQEKIFNLIGFSEEQKNSFGYFLDAFTYGAPPHGGIAPGLDRLLYVILGEKSIREIIAFPASSGGQTSVMDAPSFVSEEQLKELHISVKNK